MVYPSLGSVSDRWSAKGQGFWKRARRCHHGGSVWATMGTSLSALMGVPIGLPTEQGVRVAVHMDFVPCRECGRSIQRHALRCVCCGAKSPRGVADTVSD